MSGKVSPMHRFPRRSGCAQQSGQSQYI